MHFDPKNPVVKLCSEGIMAEAEEGGVAKKIFEKHGQSPPMILKNLLLPTTLHAISQISLIA